MKKASEMCLSEGYYKFVHDKARQTEFYANCRRRFLESDFDYDVEYLAFRMKRNWFQSNLDDNAPQLRVGSEPFVELLDGFCDAQYMLDTFELAWKDHETALTQTLTKSEPTKNFLTKAEHGDVNARNEFETTVQEFLSEFGDFSATTDRIGNLMIRAWQFMEDGDWESAAVKIDNVLDDEPNCALAFLALICVDILKSIEDNTLTSTDIPVTIANHKYHKHIVKDSIVKARLDSYIQTIENRILAALDKALAPLRERFPKDKIAEQDELDKKRKAAEKEIAEKNVVIQVKNDELMEKYNADCQAWSIEKKRIETQNTSRLRKWEKDKEAIQIEAGRLRARGLCPHCEEEPRGKIGFRGICKKKICGREASNSVILPPPPMPLESPSQPQQPRMLPPHKLDESQYIVKNENYANSGNRMRVTIDGIDWLVLDVKGGKVLLLSEKILEQRAYNTDQVDITWEQCTLRKYLNNEFYNKLGTAKTAISTTNNKNDNNLWYGTNGGNDTQDKIFLLSLEEVDYYFGDSRDYLSKRRKSFTSVGKIVADNSGGSLSNNHDSSRKAKFENDYCRWWLRSPGSYGRIACVGDVVYIYGFNGTGGVRPALWLNLYSDVQHEQTSPEPAAVKKHPIISDSRNEKSKKIDKYQTAYDKYAEADWDYVPPSAEPYDMIMKNRNAYLFREMSRNGEVESWDVEALAKIDAIVRKNNR